MTWMSTFLLFGWMTNESKQLPFRPFDTYHHFGATSRAADKQHEILFWSCGGGTALVSAFGRSFVQATLGDESIETADLVAPMEGFMEASPDSWHRSNQ